MASQDPSLAAKELLVAVVKSGASRHVVAAVSCALFRSVVESDSAIKVVNELMVHEELATVVEQELGPGVGIGEVCRRLKNGGFENLAASVSQQHRARKKAGSQLATAAARSTPAGGGCWQQQYRAVRHKRERLRQQGGREG